ncbi:MAG TPA: HAMP domain-containing sensor histidine kinase [Thermoleophilia bacterium]|nr:HAMP domain-containing sensor histidine kinase [Thermoleophilia bacterium]
MSGSRAARSGTSGPRGLAVFVAGTLAAVVVGLLVFSLLMRPPQNDFVAMAEFLGITALISVGVGVLVVRLGWMRRSPRLAWTLMAGYLLAAALTFLNVVVTARLMFLSRHDLLLSTVLLVFAAIIAVSLGSLLTGGVTAAIARLNRAARSVSGGDLDVVVPVEGCDEVAELAASFNEMTVRLRNAERARLEIETARSHLLTAVGHDLRTPLASVRVIVEALSDGVVDDPATVARYLRTAEGDLNALSHLVDDLFMLAHLESGGVELERQPNSMTDLISDILESFALRAEQQKVTLRGEPCRTADVAEFDARYVERALANLVENALRYTPPGGEVVLQTDSVPEGLSVKVSDTGPGIAEADIPKVFDRFYRGEASRSRATGGSGLGLAIVKGVIEAHGGSVAVETAPGRGTTFSFVLPA